MSTDAGSHAGVRTADVGLDGAIGPSTFRLFALGCVLVLTAAYVSVLREVTRVVGGTETLFALVGGLLVAATVLAWTIRPRTATVVAAAAGAGGFAYYLERSGVGVGVLHTAGDELLADTVALATGLPLLRMVEAGVWTLAFVPAPVFLSWYLAVRGRYALGVLPGGLALVFLVLTGDAGTMVTLVGTLAAIGAVGVGELERRGGSIAQADLLAVVIAASLVLSLSVTFVPAGGERATPFGDSSADTLEGQIDASADQSPIGGSVELSPEVRFTVESDRETYWRTGVYDRFTGDEWVRTGDRVAYEDGIEGPPGDYEPVRQVVTAETDLGVMPTAAQPVAIEGDLASHAEVSRHGQVHPDGLVLEGDSYAVESAVVDPDPDALRAAGTEYPDEITDTYLQTPEDTSSEFEAAAAEITADADDPYEAASAIERHLRSSKGYSLDVERPDGNVAEAFLLEMEEGYCVYFATTMVQLLRAEEIPARYVTGYTSGQAVDDDEYVVRGTDAHAWVEVYFPGHGWVEFEPTPGESRDAVHDEHVEDARDDGQEDVDTDESEDEPVSDEDEEPPRDPDDGETLPAGNESDREDGNETPPNESESDDSGPDPPDPGTDEADDEGLLAAAIDRLTVPREVAAGGLVVLVGLAAAVHRTGAVARARRGVGHYWQRRTGDPDRDVERAFERLEALLARNYRPRRRSETPRRYLAAIEAEREGSLDPRAETVLERYERAVYGGGVDRETADETVTAVDSFARERLPIVGDRSS